ncbi:hypothetical protein V1264_006316 [Littorina saxatilis]|uniref:Reverse transcriptase domain-containing protein n=1 Tax=Littorina saxatilis TaxID=31220 RepID=A0AAN9G4C9_9CAEN
MTENKLKLNSEKTEALLVGTRQKIASLTVTDLQLDDATVPFSPAVKSLGVFLDSTLSMQTHISFIIKTCFFHLRRIASIRRYLTHDACVKLVVSLIFSRLDYCNSLLAGLPASSIHGLQRVQNAAARLTLRKTKRDHITPYFAPCTGSLSTPESPTNCPLWSTSVSTTLLPSTFNPPWTCTPSPPTVPFVLLLTHSAFTSLARNSHLLVSVHSPPRAPPSGTPCRLSFARAPLLTRSRVG